MLSTQGLFKISFHGADPSEGPLKILPSNQNSYLGTVIGRANQAFTIKVEATEKTGDQVVFGAKLFIDNQEVFDRKTFKRRGNFFGFRKGMGNYDQFTFTIPEYLSNVTLKEEEDGAMVSQKAKQMGEVRIIFFSAYEKWVKVNNSKNRNPRQSSVDFISVPQADSKAIQTRALSVGIGQQFQISPMQNKERYRSQYGEELVCRMNENDPIDTACIRYSNTSTLIMLGMLDLFSKNHWRYLSPVFLKNNDLALTAIVKQLLTPNKSLEEVKDHIESELGFPLQQVIEGPVEQYLKKLKLKPAVTREDLVEAATSGKFKKFCTDPKIVPKPPVEDIQDKNFLGKRESPSRARPNNRVPPRAK